MERAAATCPRRECEATLGWPQAALRCSGMAATVERPGKAGIAREQVSQQDEAMSRQGGAKARCNIVVIVVAACARAASWVQKRQRSCAESATTPSRTCNPPRALDSSATGGRGGEQKRCKPSTLTRNRKVGGAAAEGLARPPPPLIDARLLALPSRVRICGAMRGGRCGRPSSASSSSSVASEPSSLVLEDDSVLEDSAMSDSRSVPEASALACAPPWEWCWSSTGEWLERSGGIGMAAASRSSSPEAARRCSRRGL